jgi:hypothetical protein
MLLSDGLDRIETARNFGGSYDPRAILNRCGVYFFALRPWRFTRRMTGTATLLAGTARISLPLGCTRVLSIEPVDTSTGCIVIVDAQTFNTLRTSSGVQSETYSYYATEEWATDAGGEMVRRLALHREPTSTLSQAFNVCYEAGWTNATSQSCASPGEYTLPIPDYAQPLFEELLEAYTLGMEEPNNGTVSERVARVLEGPLYAAAIDADMRAVMDSGYVQNGWLSQRTSTEPLPTINL